MATRRAFTSTALRAAAQTLVSRPARPAFTAASRAQLLRPAVNQGDKSWGSRRWYSVDKDEVVLDSKIWEFKDIKELVEGKDGKKVVLVDVREPVELFETGKIPGAINIPITSAIQSFHIPEEDFEDMYGFERPSKDTELMFYCKAGIRARAAAGLAKHAGWDKVGEYPGSWLDWEKQNGPVEKLEGSVDQGEKKGDS